MANLHRLESDRPDLAILLNKSEQYLRPVESDQAIVTALLEATKLVVERMNQIEPNPTQQRKGGVLVVGRSGANNPFLVTKAIGEMPAPNPDAPKELDKNKLAKYIVFAWSKLAVLVLYKPALSSGLAAVEKSLLNIDGAAIPGGAFRLMYQDQELLISFSGYSTGEDDEVVGLAACVLAKVLEKEEAIQLAEQLGNQRFAKLLNKLLHQ